MHVCPALVKVPHTARRAATSRLADFEKEERTKEWDEEVDGEDEGGRNGGQ